MVVPFTEKGKPGSEAEVCSGGSRQEQCFGRVMFERPLRPLNENSKYTLGYMGLEIGKRSRVER